MNSSRPKAAQRSRLWGIVLLLMVAGLTATLALRALEENIVFFYAPGELLEMPTKPSQTFRLGGLVAKDSYRYDTTASGRTHYFDLHDGNGRVEVHFRGVLPDLFREGQGIIGVGRWQNDHFAATELLAKHDENYMPKEIVDTLKQTGVWQDGQAAR